MSGGLDRFRSELIGTNEAAIRGNDLSSPVDAHGFLKYVSFF